MKMFLTISFILMSLLSTFVEEESLVSFDLDCESVSLSCADKEPIKNHNDHHCHESNCFESTHFGHGFYFAESPFTVNSSKIEISQILGFFYSGHHSLVYLDNLFRPPLS